MFGVFNNLVFFGVFENLGEVMNSKLFIGAGEINCQSRDCHANLEVFKNLTNTTPIFQFVLGFSITMSRTISWMVNFSYINSKPRLSRLIFKCSIIGSPW